MLATGLVQVQSSAIEAGKEGHDLHSMDEQVRAADVGAVRPTGSQYALSRYSQVWSYVAACCSAL